MVMMVDRARHIVITDVDFFRQDDLFMHLSRLKQLHRCRLLRARIRLVLAGLALVACRRHHRLDGFA